MGIFSGYGMGYGAGLGPGVSFLFLVVAWTLFWKGLALWHASRRGQYWWFIIMLVVNTIGILEIVYLFAIAGIKPHELLSVKKEGEDKPRS